MRSPPERERKGYEVATRKAMRLPPVVRQGYEVATRNQDKNHGPATSNARNDTSIVVQTCGTNVACGTAWLTYLPEGGGVAVSSLLRTTASVITTPCVTAVRLRRSGGHRPRSGGRERENGGGDDGGVDVGVAGVVAWRVDNGSVIRISPFAASLMMSPLIAAPSVSVLPTARSVAPSSPSDALVCQATLILHAWGMFVTTFGSGGGP
jgi:hypothetical protein